MSTPILHLTHHLNLPTLLRSGALWAPNHRPPELPQPRSAAHEHLQERRSRKRVPCGPGGVLHDYAPFYFGARSPMLYANHKGYVKSNPEGQRPLVYLVSSAERVRAGGHTFVFTDGHAVAAYSRFFHDLRDLAKVDWEVAHTREWKDTEEDPDRKRRKQAEFLVFRSAPADLFEEVVVLDRGIQAQVAEVVQGCGANLPVRIDRSWYY